MAAIDQVVVIGASGFGRECLDVLEAMITKGAGIDVVGVADDTPSDVNLRRLDERGVRYIGTVDDWLREPTEVKYLLAINNTEVRKRLVARLDTAGLCATRAVHPNVTVGACASFADGVVICAGATLSNNVIIERHVHVNPGVTVGHDAVLQQFASINPASTISGLVTVGDEALVGAGSVILQGLSVGRKAIIGAGSVVTKNVPDGATVKGVPGRW